MFKELASTVLNSLVIAVPILVILFIIAKLIGHQLDKKRLEQGKKSLGTGQGFLNLYIGVVIVFGIAWIILTALLN